MCVCVHVCVIEHICKTVVEACIALTYNKCTWNTLWDGVILEW